MGQVVGFVELVSPASLVSFDGAVELGAFGREDEEREAADLAGGLELSPELGAAVDLDTGDREGGFGDELVEEGGGIGGGGAGGDLAEGPLCDGIIGCEVLDRLAGSDVDEQRVDLDQLAWERWPEAFGQATGVSFLVVVAEAASSGFSAQQGHGDDCSSGDESSKDAPDRRDGGHEAFAGEQHGDLALAPHGVVEPQFLDRFGECWRPARLAHPQWPSAQRLGPLLPAVEGCARDTHGPRRGSGAEPFADGLPPAMNNVSPDRRFAIGGFRADQA